jgi:hypothetical protein
MEDFDPKLWTLKSSVDRPMQPNAVSCGVMTLWYAWFTSQGKVRCATTLSKRAISVGNGSNLRPPPHPAFRTKSLLSESGAQVQVFGQM